MTDSPVPDPDEPGVPEEILEVLRELTGGRDIPPAMLQQLSAFGLADADPAQLRMMAGQLRAMFGGGTPGMPVGFAPGGDGPFEGAPGSGVDGRVAAAVARQHIDDDREVHDQEVALAGQAVQVATLWLDEVTDLGAPTARGVAWSRAEWVDRTMPAWERLVAPVAEGVAMAIGDSMRARLAGDESGTLSALAGGSGVNPAALLGQVQGVVDRMSGAIFTTQLGEALGTLAEDVVTGTEVCLPLVPEDEVAILPVAVAQVSTDLELDLDEVWLYLAVRETARHRLFRAVPWLGDALERAVHDHAAGTNVDTESVEAALSSADPSDPESLRDALGGSLFAPAATPEQAAALARLETWLALIEGWVDVVTSRATTGHLPHAAALGEAVRRRRATDGPAQKAFATLVGLELRPRRLRDAANLWAALEERHGAEGRDRVWSHPDQAPSADDLDDVLRFVERAGASATDDEIDAFLRDALGEDDDPRPDAP